MKRFLTIVFVATGFLLAQAHEFWLQPNKFRYRVGETATIDFLVGENFTGEFWNLDRHRVESLKVYSRAGEKEWKTQVKKQKGKNLELPLSAAGTHLVALQSNAAFIELGGVKFNEYLEEDGLENILSARKKSNDTTRAREFYTRYAKLLIQAGPTTDNTFQKRVGFPIEIIPLQNPYNLKSGDYLDCRVEYKNQPLAHQKVKVWSFIGNRIFLQNLFTEKDGTLRFPLSNKGPWMVSTVVMEKSARPEADYESRWASLVFGID
jgi:uncharacterized GH25 family protein